MDKLILSICFLALTGCSYLPWYKANMPSQEPIIEQADHLS